VEGSTGSVRRKRLRAIRCRAIAGGWSVVEFNIAPTQPVPVIIESESDGRRMIVCRWGLVPGWAKDTSMARQADQRASGDPGGEAIIQRGTGLETLPGSGQWLLRVAKARRVRREDCRSSTPGRGDVRLRRTLGGVALVADGRGTGGGEALVVRTFTIITCAAKRPYQSTITTACRRS
jgi:hypothetical protein